MLRNFMFVYSLLSGCFEAPIQLIYNVWLVMNGHQEAKLEVKCNYYQDLYSNPICIPVSVSLSIIFSIVAMLASVFNINSSQNRKINASKWSCFKHVPFLVAGIFLKMISVAFLVVLLLYAATKHLMP